MIFADVRKLGDIYIDDVQRARIDALLSESDSLRHFLEEMVFGCDHSDLTVSEIVQAYAEYCPTKGWNPKDITIVHRELQSLMLLLFQRVLSKSLKRNGINTRGFRRVRLKGEELEY